jgi:hypothetical protein
METHHHPFTEQHGLKAELLHVYPFVPPQVASVETILVDEGAAEVRTVVETGLTKEETGLDEEDSFTLLTLLLPPLHVPNAG